MPAGPYALLMVPALLLSTPVGSYTSWQMQAHDSPVSALALHPTKSIVATVSDDGLWKMWSLSGGGKEDLIMSGEGESDAPCSHA